MVQISKKRLHSTVENKLSELLYEVLGKARNKKEFINIYSDIFSPTERVMISKRIAVFYLNLQDIPFDNIKRVLKISNATVAKFSIISQYSKGIIPVLRRILKSEKTSILLLKLLDLLFPPGQYGSNWSAGWERKKRIKKKEETGI